MGNVENVENNKNAKFIDKHIKRIKYLECRKLWVKKNKDNVNNYARANYLKKLNDYGDEYRTKLNNKNRETRNLKKEQRNKFLFNDSYIKNRINEIVITI